MLSKQEPLDRASILQLATTARNQWHRQVSIRISADRGSRVLFDHGGEVDHTVVHRLLSTAEAACMEANDPVSLRKRLFNVVVESLESALQHAHGAFRESTFATLLDSNQGYRMMLGNVLPPEEADLLASRIMQLNGMDEDDLKYQFQGTLRDNERTENGAAGLGLVTMARKSMRPILARTRRIHSMASLFVVELFVPRF